MRLRTMTLGLAFLVGVAFPVSAGAFTVGPPEVVSSNLEWFTPGTGHSIQVVADPGVCAGEPNPRVSQIQVREGGRLPGGRRKVVVTLQVERPAPLKPEPAPPPGPEGPSTLEVCAGKAAEVRPHIRVKPLAEEVVVYDGSFSPPRRVPRVH